MEHIVDEKGLSQVAEEFIRNYPAVSDRATVIGLSGDLGSGKTAFVKAIARTLGVAEAILSPTFVIAKFYQLGDRLPWQTLVHVDAYRIENPEELRALKWEEIVTDRRNLVMIEWPEQLGEFFPPDAPMLHFRFIDETHREIKVPITVPI